MTHPKLSKHHKNEGKMVGSAIRRTRPMLARYDVSPHMVKWWKSQLKDDGQVRSTLSDQRRNMATNWHRMVGPSR